MKKFICGFIVGAIIFSLIGAYAATTYVANPLSYKVVVNGEDFTSDPPPVEIEGRTYLPLRAMGDALGVPVNWNEKLQQAEVGYIIDKTQYSRMNPAPIGTSQLYTYKNTYDSNDNYTVSVTVLETIRGKSNIDKVRKAVVTDDTPKEGYELIMAKISVSAISINGDKAIEPSRSSFSCFTSKNEETESAYLHMEGQDGFDWLSGKLYAGGNSTGWIVFQVKKDDPNPKLVYKLDYNGTGGIWFSLTK